MLQGHIEADLARDREAADPVDPQGILATSILATFEKTPHGQPCRKLRQAFHRAFAQPAAFLQQRLQWLALIDGARQDRVVSDHPGQDRKRGRSLRTVARGLAGAGGIPMNRPRAWAWHSLERPLRGGKIRGDRSRDLVENFSNRFSNRDGLEA